MVLRDFIREAVGKDPIVSAKNTHLIDVVIARNEQKTFVHLINNGGRHSSPNPTIFDEIVPLCGLELEIQAEKEPKRICVRPSGKELTFRYENGKIFVTVDKLEIYDILEIE